MRSCSKQSSVLVYIRKLQRFGQALAKREKCKDLIQCWFVFQVFSKLGSLANFLTFWVCNIEAPSLEWSLCLELQKEQTKQVIISVVGVRTGSQNSTSDLLI